MTKDLPKLAESQAKETSCPTRWVKENSEDTIERIQRTKRFTVDDIDLISETFKKGVEPGTGWERLHDSYLVLPSWFKSNLNPLSSEFRGQQLKLWRELSGVDRDYNPALDELEIPLKQVDPIRRPGYYKRRDALAIDQAGNHLIATGMLMKHSGIKAGCWALEYGSGFGQIALILARMGVNVDTVDISSTLCGYVKEQAEFFGVKLSPFHGQYGYIPRADHKYDLIYFYESLHHCFNFRETIAAIKNALAPGGKIMFAGEPVRRGPTPAIPYPWGLRLAAQVVATIRARHWMELGFIEDFIVNLFVNEGFTAVRHNCNVSTYGETRSFTLRADHINLASHWMPDADAATWRSVDSEGRLTSGQSTMALDATDSFKSLDIVAVNRRSHEESMSIMYGGKVFSVTFAPGERKRIPIDASNKSRKISFSTPVPALDNQESSQGRQLGMVIEQIQYV